MRTHYTLTPSQLVPVVLTARVVVMATARYALYSTNYRSHDYMPHFLIRAPRRRTAPASASVMQVTVAMPAGHVTKAITRKAQSVKVSAVRNHMNGVCKYPV